MRDAEALYMDVHVQGASARVCQGQEQKAEIMGQKADLGGKLKIESTNPLSQVTHVGK